MGPPPGPPDRIPEVSDQTHTAASGEKAHFSGVKIHISSDSQGGSNPEEEREGVNSTEVGDSPGGTGVWRGSAKEAPPVLHVGGGGGEAGGGGGQQRGHPVL